MVDSAELLIVMTDRLKIVRIHARNVPRVHEHKRLDDDVFLAFLSLHESDGVACSMRRGAVQWKHKKIACRQPDNVWQWLLSKKIAAAVRPLHFDSKSEQSYCNKSSVK